MRFFSDFTREPKRSALAVGIGVCGSFVFLFDCGGSTFTSAGGGGAGGEPAGGNGGTAALGGTNGASAGQVGRGGTSSAGAASGGMGAGGMSAGGKSAGGSSAGGTTAGTGGVITAGAGGVSAGGTGGMPTSVCPSTAPTGGACVSGLSCTYGADLRSSCRVHYQCTNGLWNSHGSVCGPLADCGTRDGGIPQVGTACTAAGEDCTLNGGTSGLIYCRCDQHLNPVSTVWDCVGPPLKPCPQILPNEGQPCDGSATDTCLYGSCSMQTVDLAPMQCVNKVWVNEPAACAN